MGDNKANKVAQAIRRVIYIGAFGHVRWLEWDLNVILRKNVGRCVRYQVVVGCIHRKGLIIQALQAISHCNWDLRSNWGILKTPRVFQDRCDCRKWICTPPRSPSCYYKRRPHVLYSSFLVVLVCHWQYILIAGTVRSHRYRSQSQSQSRRLKKLRNILDKMRRCYLLALCPSNPLLPPPLTGSDSQRYSTTALAAVHLISLIVCASAAASSCFEG